jgi:hypothetical protein
MFEFLDLYREPENTPDRNAIYVATKAGAKLGYLNRHAATEIAGQDHFSFVVTHYEVFLSAPE